ncbi:hypothetical protein Mal64_32030 [Pseudobythopirellula maris]|uniref:Uncharacterized protein n=1 Tax=Pseudobythopirellula maris TaxID=2527991 RepID=A0A5C5ZLG3_9BACT|nr:hypothetical protein [Pseudobythopirellula maris]TWT87661.1 hypothetical protein Mal64_32030 [Pseudobythopirellula maris]
MFRPLAFALPLLFLATTTAWGQESLFSDVAIESVFADETAPEASNTTAAAAGRVTGAGQLAELLEKSGLEGKREGAATVSTKIAESGLTLPATLTVAVDRDQIDVAMTLRKLAEGETLSSKSLLELITTADTAPGVYFVYNASESRLELRHTLSNRGLTPSRLERALRSMARLAELRQKAWGSGKDSDETAANTSSSTPAATPTAAADAPAASAAGLPIGSWIATVGDGQAFAIRIAEDGAFNLVHVKDGKSTTSTGQATRTGDRLTLSGKDNLKIAGNLSGVSADGFELKLGATTLQFKPAKP